MKEKSKDMEDKIQNFTIIGSNKRRELEKTKEEIIEKIMAENFPNMQKNTVRLLRLTKHHEDLKKKKKSHFDPHYNETTKH